MHRWAGIVAAVLVGFATWTQGAVQSATQAPGATPSPTFTERVERAARSDILDYAHRLSFDSSPGWVDARRLSWRIDGHDSVGPFAEIARERGAHLLHADDLARGRIIARVRAAGPAPLLGLPTGVSYLWADSGATGARFVVVPDDPTEPLRELPMVIQRHSLVRDCINDPNAQTGGASWEQGGLVWVPCGCFACCCVPGGICHPLRWLDRLNAINRDIVVPTVRVLSRVP